MIIKIYQIFVQRLSEFLIFLGYKSTAFWGFNISLNIWLAYPVWFIPVNIWYPFWFKVWDDCSLAEFFFIFTQVLNTRKATSLYNNKICKFVVSFVFILYSFVLIVQIFLEPIVSDIRKQFQRLKKNGLLNIKLFTGRFILNPICSSHWIHVH